MADFPELRGFMEENEALHLLLQPLTEPDFTRATAFRSWSVSDILTHLHVWNRAALLSIADPAAFQDFTQRFLAARDRAGIRSFENEMVNQCAGHRLLETWHQGCLEAAERLSSADPQARVSWIGPDMSVRSAVAARLMETWSHAQALYDLMAIDRIDTDRIHSIAVLGVKTFGWSFKVHGQEAPACMPFVSLRAPSGALWTWGDSTASERIEGLATEFCQVVTQTRNVADTLLLVTGETARQWMAHAQCFAGLARMPPEPGFRKRQALRWGPPA